MDSKTYIKNATRTESVPSSLEMNQLSLHATLQLAIAASQIMDQVKKKLYYGQPIDADKVFGGLYMANQMVNFLASQVQGGIDIGAPLEQDNLVALMGEVPDAVHGINLANIDVRLMHAAIGCFTESGELLQAMKAQYETGIIDRINFGEEVGDIEWYQAIGFDASGVSEADCREKNIAKLMKRYPDKFNSDAAINRDVTAERAILEGDTTEYLLASPANAARLEASVAQLRTIDTPAAPLN